MSSQSQRADDPIITALKQRMLARAAPRLAHDLNNDLTIISGQAELAQRLVDHRLQERMEQIKLAARRASERNQLIQQLAQDDASSRELLSGVTVADDVQRLAELLAYRHQAFAASAHGLLPAVDRTRLRWIIGAVLMAPLPCLPENCCTITLAMTRGGGGLRMDCNAQGSGPADWLSPTLAHCATAADVVTNEQGWQALILLAEAS